MNARDRTLNTLLEQLLLPLACGGDLRPIAPLGARRAISMLEKPFVIEGDAAERLRDARLSVARQLYPIDGLDDPVNAEWLLGLALNDLLQVTNPSLESPFGRSNADRLLAMVREVIDAAGAPRTLGEALSRHATFCRLLEVTRIDTFVSFWVGSQSFAGARPPRRLLMWPRLRRVSEHEQTLCFVDMAKEASWGADFVKTLERLLAASPLTDLANLRRNTPDFRWSAASLALLRNPVGRSLALRAIDRAGDAESAIGVLVTSSERIDDESGEARLLVFELVEALRARSGRAASRGKSGA